MSTTPIQGADPFKELAASLMRTVDTNRDGSLSSEEFSSFLSRMLGGVGSTTTALAAPSMAAGRSSSAGGSPISANKLEGFDGRKLADPNHLTVKYKFARVAQYHDVGSVRGKADAQALLTNMRPELEAAGITVLDVQKDKIQVLDDHGQAAWIDVIRGAESGAPGWHWMDTRY